MDDQPPEATSTVRSLWQQPNWRATGGAALVMALALVIGLVSRASANGAATEYRDDVAEWKRDGLPTLIDTATPPDGWYELSEYTSSKSLKKHQKWCRALDTSATKLADDREALRRPTPDKHLLGMLSGQYRAARGDADDHAEQVDQYREQAKETFEQLSTDCAFSLEMARLLAKQDQRLKGVKKTYMKKGEVLYGGGYSYSCSRSEGCIPPPVGGRFDRYVTAYSAYLKARKEWAELDRSSTCTSSSLGKVLCKQAAEQMDAINRADAAWFKEMKKTRGDGSGKLDKLAEAYDKSLDTTAEKFGSVALETFPELDEISYFDPEYADDWITLMALQELKVQELEHDTPTE